MGRCIIKVAQDEDLYLTYSSVIDSWILIGNREETLSEIKEQFGLHGDFDALDRADENGTSDRNYQTGAWDDDYIRVLNQAGDECRWLERKDLSSYANLILADQRMEADALTEPIDWEA